MLIKSEIKMLNKKSNKYTGKDGVERESFKITFSQDDDNIVGDMNVKQNIYDIMEKGKEYEVIGEYLTTKNGNYTSWFSAKPLPIGGKGTI